MNRLLVLAAAALAAAAGAWWLWKEQTMNALAEVLRASLPPRLARFGAELAAAAVRTAPAELGARAWAFLLAGVMDRESRGGDVLSPRGPAGTGDVGHGRGLMQIDDRPYHLTEDDPRYNQKEAARSVVRMDFIESGDWADPVKNIAFGAAHLRFYYDQADSLPAAIAAYNAGPKALTARDPDSVTTGGNYSRDVQARAAGWA
jgi:hypothetical protein